MKGINAFSAMSGVDDRFVMASLLPADLPGGVSATAKVRKQEKDTWFTRVTSSGWFVAAVSLVVAFGVLAGIVAAGRMAPQNPSPGPGPSSGFPAGTLQNMPESEHDESDESDESHDPHEDGSDIPVETSPVFDDPVEPEKNTEDETYPSDLKTDVVAVISDGSVVYPNGYRVFASGQQVDKNGESVGFDSTGLGAEAQLSKIWNELPAMQTVGDSYRLVLPANMTLQSIRVLEMTNVGGKLQELVRINITQASPNDMTALSSLAQNVRYAVVMQVSYDIRYSDDEYIQGVDEYAFRLVVRPKTFDIVLENITLDNGHMLWTEQWYDGGMVSGDGAGAEGQLSDLVAEGALEKYRLRHPADTPFWFGLGDHEAPLDRVVVYDMSLNRLGEATNFMVLHELPAGEYIVILTVTLKGDYIPEADAFEAACYEYPFIFEVYNP